MEKKDLKEIEKILDKLVRKKDLKDLEKLAASLKTFTIAQTQLLGDLLKEIKLLRRDIKSQHITQ